MRRRDFRTDGSSLSVCWATLTVSVWSAAYLGNLCLIASLYRLYAEVTVFCHRHLRGSTVLSREVRLIIQFSECVYHGPTGQIS